MKNKKICFICSSGGHYSEIKNLKKITEIYDSFIVTEKTKNAKIDFCRKKYFVSEINRKEIFWLLKFVYLFIKSFVIFLKEKPDYVISTGALCSYPMLKIASLFKRKIIFIESFARTKDLSTTGKKVYKFASLFIVQWKDLVEKYPNAKYYGTIYGDLLL